LKPISPLAQLLIDAGLIQFGWFRRGEETGTFSETCPFSLHLDMLASYPAALAAVVDAAQTAAQGVEFDRLLCPFDAVPFGVALGLRTGVPLVYSRGSGDQPVSDLIGAYDIGHPALLLTNSVGWEAYPTPLIAGARRVGLKVHTLLTILETRRVKQAVAVISLLRLGELVGDMEAAGRIPARHAQAVLEWVAG
jgi:hypothetical protein